MKKTLSVKIDDRTITVSELPLVKYAQLLKAIKQLPLKLPEFANKSSDQVLAQLPSIIGECWDDAINILVIATDLKKEEIEQMGLADATRLITAIAEVNDYSVVMETIKKALARPALQKQIARTTGSTGQ